jgi:hypothetical protein
MAYIPLYVRDVSHQELSDHLPLPLGKWSLNSWWLVSLCILGVETVKVIRKWVKVEEG